MPITLEFAQWSQPVALGPTGHAFLPVSQPLLSTHKRYAEDQASAFRTAFGI